MYENYNKTRKKVNEYEKLISQTRGGYTAYDKGKAGLPTTENQTKAPTPPLRKSNNYPNDSLLGLGRLPKASLIPPCGSCIPTTDTKACLTA